MSGSPHDQEYGGQGGTKGKPSEKPKDSPTQPTPDKRQSPKGDRKTKD